MPDLWVPPTEDETEAVPEAERRAEAQAVVDEIQDNVRHIHAGDSGSGGDAQGEVPPPAEDPTGYPGLDGGAEEVPVEDYLTYFVVVVDMKGCAAATSDNLEAFMQNKRFARPADLNDMWRACAEIQRDIDHMGVTQRVVHTMQMISAQMAEQQQQAQIMAELARKGMRPDGTAIR